MSTILIIFEKEREETSANYTRFAEELSAYGGDSYDHEALENLTYYFGYQTQAITTSAGRDIASYNAVYFRSWHANADLAYACALYLLDRKVPFIDKEVGSQASLAKTSEYAQLSLAGIRIPDTFVTKDESLIAGLFEKHHKLIAKDAVADRGRNNHLVSSYKELQEVTGVSPASTFVLQPAIANDGDYRLVVYGDEVGVAVKLQAAGGDFHHSTSPKGTATKVNLSDLPKGVLEQSLRAAKTLKRDMGGVDVIIDTSGVAYILEVNYSPRILTGAFAEGMMSSVPPFLNRLAGGK